MTGADIQERADALVQDLSTNAITLGVGQVADVAYRNEFNELSIVQIEVDAGGNVTANGLQAKVDDLKPLATAYETAKTAYDAKNVSKNYAAISATMGEYHNV